MIFQNSRGKNLRWTMGKSCGGVYNIDHPNDIFGSSESLRMVTLPSLCPPCWPLKWNVFGQQKCGRTKSWLTYYWSKLQEMILSWSFIHIIYIWSFPYNQVLSSLVPGLECFLQISGSVVAIHKTWLKFSVFTTQNISYNPHRFLQNRTHDW